MRQSSAFLLPVGGFKEQGRGKVGFGVKNRILYGRRKEDLVRWGLVYRKGCGMVRRGKDLSRGIWGGMEGPGMVLL